MQIFLFSKIDDVRVHHTPIAWEKTGTESTRNFDVIF
jgi:hypothetical protein